MYSFFWCFGLAKISVRPAEARPVGGALTRLTPLRAGFAGLLKFYAARSPEQTVTLYFGILFYKEAERKENTDS